MPINPLTGQTALMPYEDPTALGQLQADQSRADMLGNLGQALMQRGYTPNSGFAGALAQMAQAAIGMKMLKDSQAKMADVYTRQAQVQAAAAQAARQAARDDATFKTDEEIRKESGVARSKKEVDEQYADQDSQRAIHQANAIAQGNLPIELQKIAAENTGKITAAQAGQPRAYTLHTDTGADVLVNARGETIYSAPSAGGGKLSPTDQAIVDASKQSLEQFNQKYLAGQQARSQIHNYVSNLTGAPLEKVQGMSPEQIRDSIQNAPSSNAWGAVLPWNSSKFDTAARNAAIDIAGTKRPSPTDTDVKAELNNAPGPWQTKETQANIIYNQLRELDKVGEERAAAQSAIDARDPRKRNVGAQGAIPAGAVAQPGNGAVGIHYIFNPQNGKLEPAQ